MNEELKDTRQENGQGNKKTLMVVLVVILLVLAGGGYYIFGTNKTEVTTDTGTSSEKSTNETATEEAPVKKTWQGENVAIAGKYADADIIDLGNGQYRMYYSAEPEVPGFNGQVYSATSNDGMTWTTETGERKTMATFPDIVKLPDGRLRMYFQNAGVIKSATSTDGFKFTDETGTRIDAKEPGYTLSNVGAQSTTLLPDGSYLMAYRGTIDQPYQTTEKLPNQNTQLYFYATSPDGLNFTKKGVALDSRNETLYGLADGGEWVRWDPSTDSTSSLQASAEQVDLRLYFWSYTGVYYSTYNDGVFSEASLDFPASKNPGIKFSPNPPGDPTLMKIGDKWFMYYGQHEKGIYFATFK